MPRAGWCDVDNTWVWVNEDGSCVNGHGPEHVSRLYDTDEPQAPREPVTPQYPAQPPVAPSGYQPSYGGQQGWQPPVVEQRSNKPVASLVLGIASIFCCVPIITIPCAIAGIALGVQGLKTPQRGLAIAGIALSAFGLAAGVLNAALGAWFAVNDPSLMRDFGEGFMSP